QQLLSACTSVLFLSFFFFNDPATTEIYTLSLHDALPISARVGIPGRWRQRDRRGRRGAAARGGLSLAAERAPGLRVRRADRRRRSEEHTSELQSRFDLVCRLLLEKKKKKQKNKRTIKRRT